MDLLVSYRTRVRGRSDSEHNQALLRVAIVLVMLAYTAWVARQSVPSGVRIWPISVFGTVSSLLLFGRILQKPRASPRRRVVGAIHDSIVTTLWLYVAGPMGALGLFAYPWVTVGNGFRYGVKYLAFSGFLGAMGMATLIAIGPGWVSNPMIGYGVLLSHIVVTIYTGILLNRLQETQGQLEKMATYDALTGLPNRRFFMDQLSRMVVAQDRPQMACLYLDLDGFKAVNDRCGHKVGDELLNQVAVVLRGCIRATDTLARLGGDEFTVVLNGPADREDARATADRIIAGIEAIPTIDGQSVHISVSIGISFIAAGGLHGPFLCDELLKAADDAMYAAKRSGKGHYQFVDFAAA